MGLSPKSNYEKKISFLVLTLGKFLEALGSGIGTAQWYTLLNNWVQRVFLDKILDLLYLKVFTENLVGSDSSVGKAVDQFSSINFFVGSNLTIADFFFSLFLFSLLIFLLKPIFYKQQDMYKTVSVCTDCS